MSNTVTTIGDIAQVFDGPHATPKKIDKGPYFLSISSLESGKLDLSKSARISEEQFIKWTRRVTPRENDLLFSYETRLGEAALMPAKLRACLGRRMGLLRPDVFKVDPKYLLYAYLGPAFQNEIRRRTNRGATVDRIALKELPTFPINLPVLSEQKAIAHILGTLDDKIELNRQMNNTLEQMAQALFQSWFVDFDPVIDNALTRGNDIPEALLAKCEKRKAAPDIKKLLHTNPELAAQFPSSFVYNETLDKWIPEGWEVKSLGAVANFGNGKSSPDRVVDGVYPVFGSNGLIGRANEARWKDVIIVGRVGTYCGSLFYHKGEVWLTDNAMFAQMNRAQNNQFLFEFLKRNNLNDLSTGSGQPLLNQGILKSIPIVLPTEHILERYSDYADKLYQKKNENSRMSDSLTQLRDTLLPQLISGKLKVPEAMLQVEEAMNENGSS